MGKLTVSEPKSKPIVEPGTYSGRCYLIADIGTQTSEFGGKKTSKRQLVISWELPEELFTGGESVGMPKTLSGFYGASLHGKAALRRDLQTWRGRPFTREELESFEIEQVLGLPCLITATTTETGRSKVSAVSALPKGVDVPALVNDPIVFSIDDDTDWGTLDLLPNWIANLIKESEEYRRLDEGI